MESLLLTRFEIDINAPGQNRAGANQVTGHLHSVYPDALDGAVLWVIGENGERLRLTHSFPTTIYVEGDIPRLRAVADFLKRLRRPPETAFTYKQDLFKGTLPVLAVTAIDPVSARRLAYQIDKRFSRLNLYDVRIPFPIRYANRTGAFPLGKCNVEYTDDRKLIAITALESRWDVHTHLPTIRQMLIQPDLDPTYKQPNKIILQAEGEYWEISLQDPLAALLQVDMLIKEFDPDLIVADYGDAWLFPYLMRIAETHHIEFNPGRDPRLKLEHRKEITYHSYGDVHHRAAQTHLYGRWHVDPYNTTMGRGEEFSLNAAIELTRISGVSLQTAARNSPGSALTAMEIREAHQRGLLVPQQKLQTEAYRSALSLATGDKGGLNYRPIAGLHQNVAEIDFFSMYPSIMVSWNISGETVGGNYEQARTIPGTGVQVDQATQGLVPAVLEPLLMKRRRLKLLLRSLPKDDPARAQVQSQVDALKWIGYVAFGYAGYKNHIWGLITAHESITAVGRHVLLMAKDLALDYGFKVIAANTDSLFIKPENPLGRPLTPEDIQPLIEEINKRTGLIIELEGIFPWMMFLPSKINPLVGASNRYFGRFDDGELKVRGTRQRRRDSCRWVVDGELDLMALLAKESGADKLKDLVPEAIDLIRRKFTDLDGGRVPIEDLVWGRKLTREVEQYKSQSEAAKAARQLQAFGLKVNVGKRIRYIYTHGKKSEVIAWELPQPPSYRQINKARYKELFLDMAHQVLQLLDVSLKDLEAMVEGRVRQLELPEEDIWGWLEEEPLIALPAEFMEPARKEPVLLDA